MDEQTILNEVAETGRLLLKSGLVARTWGNFSARIDETHYAITPSGLGYEHMTADDLVTVSLTDESCEGVRKPSSEKGVHTAAYRIFPETGFVIHTHQTYATAMGLTMPEALELSEKEKEALGTVAWAKYGLPGTDRLKDAVALALKSGARTVMMRHHGTLILGKDRTEAIDRAMLLETVCKRSCRCDAPVPEKADSGALLSRLRKTFPNADVEDGDAARAWSALKVSLSTQLDDVAQMIGRKIPFAKDEKQLMKLLGRHPAVFLSGTGAIVSGEDASDTEALKLLTEKAAVCSLHTRALKTDARLRLSDCLLMRFVYKFKYSKKKEG